MSVLLLPVYIPLFLPQAYISSGANTVYHRVLSVSLSNPLSIKPGFLASTALPAGNVFNRVPACSTGLFSCMVGRSDMS